MKGKQLDEDLTSIKRKNEIKKIVSLFLSATEKENVWYQKNHYTSLQAINCFENLELNIVNKDNETVLKNLTI